MRLQYFNIIKIIINYISVILWKNNNKTTGVIYIFFFGRRRSYDWYLFYFTEACNRISQNYIHNLHIHIYPVRFYIFFSNLSLRICIDLFNAIREVHIFLRRHV